MLQMAHCPLDRLGGMRPGAFMMRIVIGPQEAVDELALAREQKSGQVVINTSAASARVQNWFALYGATRAGANALIRAAGLEAAPHGVTVNGTGTYAMDYPSFLHDIGADKDPAKRKEVEAQLPMRKLCQPE